MGQLTLLDFGSKETELPPLPKHKPEAVPEPEPEPTPEPITEPKLENDRNTYIIERVDQPVFVVKRGDMVKWWVRRGEFSEGKVTGISHAREEIKVGTQWHSYGCIYPIDYESDVGGIPDDMVLDDDAEFDQLGFPRWKHWVIKNDGTPVALLEKEAKALVESGEAKWPVRQEVMMPQKTLDKWSEFVACGNEQLGGSGSRVKNIIEFKGRLFVATGAGYQCGGCHYVHLNEIIPYKKGMEKDHVENAVGQGHYWGRVFTCKRRKYIFKLCGIEYQVYPEEGNVELYFQGDRYPVRAARGLSADRIREIFGRGASAKCEREVEWLVAQYLATDKDQQPVCPYCDLFIIDPNDTIPDENDTICLCEFNTEESCKECGRCNDGRNDDGRSTE